jgi:hypothetical protein
MNLMRRRSLYRPTPWQILSATDTKILPTSHARLIGKEADAAVSSTLQGIKEASGDAPRPP